MVGHLLPVLWVVVSNQDMGVLQQQGMPRPSSTRTGLVLYCAVSAWNGLLAVPSGGRSSLDGVTELGDEDRTLVGLEVLVMMTCRGRDSKYRPVTSCWGPAMAVAFGGMAAWGVDVQSSSTAVTPRYQRVGRSGTEDTVTQVVCVLQAIVF